MRTAPLAAGAPVSRKVFSVAEYHEMISAGVFRADEPLELIHGEIVESPRIGQRAVACRDILNREFHDNLRRQVHVRVWGPVTLTDSDEPQPDISLLRLRRNWYRDRNRSAEDILLALEESDCTLEFDRTIKVRLYAATGVRESWIVNLPNQCIEAYRKPTRRGYREVKRYKRGDSVSPLAFPDFSLRVDDVLGPK